ncbi:MAG: hypothetical protein GX939_01410 [Clostridiaceae bacterium]|jgi:peptidoglycan biosynthesis protein MviN/MurJ (putative lipid II flippase)|nr:hypothetical protein [Clostridiaceae bacterium]
MRRGRQRQDWSSSLLEDRRASGGLIPLTPSKAARVYTRSMVLVALMGLFHAVAYVPSLEFGVLSDAWVIAREWPRLLIRSLAGAALGVSVALRLKASIDRKQLARFWRGFSSAATLLLLVTIIAVLFGEALCNPLLCLFNSGKDDAVIEMAVPSARILLVQTAFLFPAAIAAGALIGTRLYHRVMIPVASIFVVAQVCFLILTRNTPEHLMGVALVLLSCAALLSLVLLFLAKRVLHWRIMIDTRDPMYRQFMRLAVPGMVAVALFQLNVLFDISFVGKSIGAVTVLDQSKSFARFLLMAFVIPVAGVMTPVLTQLFDEKRYSRARTLLTRAMRRALYIITPFSIILAVMPEDTAVVFFQWRGALPEAALSDEAALLRLYALPLILATILVVYYHAFLARRMTRMLLLAGVIAAVAHPLLSQLFIRRLNFGIRGIPIALSGTLLLLVITMAVLYRIYLREARLRKILPFAIRLIISAFAAGIVLIALNTLPVWSEHKAWQILIYFVKCLVVLLTYYVTGIVLRFRETLDTQSAWRERLKLGPIRGGDLPFPGQKHPMTKPIQSRRRPFRRRSRRR